MNKRIIMVEGCDRTGKSTFISFLKEQFELKTKEVFIIRLLGPTKFESLSFSNDEKSLIQLSKFHEAYTQAQNILNTNPNSVIIFDRCSFGEFVWANYWNRVGKYTNYLNSTEFLNSFRHLFNQTIYIDYFISDIPTLVKRIKESEEDTNIFTYNGKSIEKNISYVYNMYNKTDLVVKSFGIDFHMFNNNSNIDKVKMFASFICSETLTTL